MGRPRTRLLFVGHDASRTGAPTVGLAFLRWLVAHDQAEVQVRLLRDGPLADAHRALAPTSVTSRWAATGARAANALADPLPMASRLMTRGTGSGSGTRRNRDATVVVANTLAALPAAIHLAGSSPVVAWVHELDGVAERVLAADRRKELLPRVDRFVAVGRHVEAMLVERWGLNPERVRCVEAFVDGPSDADVPPPLDPKLRILGVGSVVPRKGVDGFAAIVSLLIGRRPNLRAAWVGGAPGPSPHRRELDHDLDRFSLGERLNLVPAVADLGPWWPQLGVLLHVPREDPFPLVVIEAARLGVPVVTWDTGGAADLLRRAGLDHLVASAGDIFGAASRVEMLLDDAGAASHAGTALKEVASGHTADVLAPRVWDLCCEAASR